MMIKLLDENENSSNAYNDSFWISKILRNLGKLDNIDMMEDIARKVYRQFNLDTVGKFSPQFAITKGAI